MLELVPLFPAAGVAGLAPTGEVKPRQKNVFPAEESFFRFFSAALVSVPFAIPAAAAMAIFAKLA
jgi:hypothetical protein